MKEAELRKEGVGEEEPFKMMDNVPFHAIGYSVLLKLATKLDPDSVIGGNNWRMLAEKLGYSTEDIFAFESQQSSHGRNTIKVLQAYCQKQNSTVNKLYAALEAIDRTDALDELKAAIPDIERAYKEKRKHAHADLQVENDCRCHSCEKISSGNSYSSYCSSMHHNKMMQPVPNYPPGHMQGNRQISLSPAKIMYHRHKSQDPPARMDGMRSHYEHPSPEFKRQRSAPMTESMVVHGRDNQSQYYRDVEPMDHSPSMREEGVPPALALMRGMHRYDGHSHHSGMMMPPEKNDRFKYPLRPPLKLEIPNPNEHHFGQMRPDFISPGVTPTTPSTPLSHLAELANQRPIQPEEGYTDLMRMKHLEELSQSKTAHFMPQNFDNHNNKHVAQNFSTGNHCQEDAGSLRNKNDPPNTFPLRLKSNSCSSPSSTSISSSQLVKSVSLPNDMKPAEFRRAFRHIKVFVTHAADDKRHTQRVISLCKNLDKNGFTVCVDIFQRKLNVEDRSDWYQKRFQEADFIIVVISPKYKKEVDSCELENDADISDSFDSEGEMENEAQSHCLHTKHIYKLMYREHIQNGHGNKRFVPVLFQGISHSLIPPWMRQAYSKLVYEWPKQFNDLLWMLTKPGNRVLENVVPSSDVEMNQTGDDCTDTTESDITADTDKESIP